MSSLRVRYQTIEFDDVDIHIRTLRDKQQFEDVDDVALKLGISSATWPLFGIIWDSSQVLAHLMFDYEIAGKRILEVGCGIALASLVLNHRLADITATDYHPEVEGFLLENTQLNKDKVIPFVRTGWADEDSGLGKFDLIIGSDLLYEQEHIELLSGFINQHANPHCEVIIIDPGRRQHARFSKKMVSLGYSHQQSKPKNTEHFKQPFKGYILRYSR
ncbi:class I SAM-dependent methyltransferase [Candidatus Venteria ishoeyi]|uniref:Putative methyltransferase n=1 Tax=Candidatus Venteria ishoeyi TaxID=1899563 RepID=A0A1H6FJQ9_9GAMM|nr:methyltransferase domain-containing protein [Candidatus Venteria ishoeyi]SEH09167.1 Putative methyltransferase [Candidatus Venteria ishoeyi]SEH09296.1 Putative methyltransferase [Candidatus Venteria ishoeyi]